MHRHSFHSEAREVPLREKREDARVVVLTGYGAIATAVAAVKIGATDYLSKPADANDINDVDILIVVHPKDLPEKTQFANVGEEEMLDIPPPRDAELPEKVQPFSVGEEPSL